MDKTCTNILNTLFFIQKVSVTTVGDLHSCQVIVKENDDPFKVVQRVLVRSVWQAIGYTTAGVQIQMEEKTLPSWKMLQQDVQVLPG